jgi:hypothetical protein
MTATTLGLGEPGTLILSKNPGVSCDCPEEVMAGLAASLAQQREGMGPSSKLVTHLSIQSHWLNIRGAWLSFGIEEAYHKKFSF